MVPLHPVHAYATFLPQPQHFTVQFCLKLCVLLEDHSKEWGLLHERPSVLTSLNLAQDQAPVP